MVQIGNQYCFGAKTGQNAEKLFLPVELMHSLDKAKIDGKPLVSKKEIVVQGVKVQPEFSFFNSIYLICVVLLILIIINNRFLFKSYLFVCGILGLFLCLVGLYSQHEELLLNYNALILNPLFIFIPFVKENFLKKLNITLLVLLLIYSIVIVTKPHLMIMLPFIIANLYILMKLNGRNPLKLLTTIK